MKVISDAAKDVWSGALRAIGALLVTLLIGWLIVCIPAVKEWTIVRFLALGAQGRAIWTIFLAVSSVSLLSLWIAARVSLFHLRDRVSRNALTLGDLAGGGRKANKYLSAAMDKVEIFEPISATATRIPGRHAIQENILKELRTGEKTANEMARCLNISIQGAEYHLQALFDDDFLDMGSPIAGYPYSLAQKGRAYLHERKLLE